MYIVNSNECTGCGTCLDICPAGAMAMVNGVAEIDQKRCTSCGLCMDECPQNAVQEVERAPALYAETGRESMPLERRVTSAPARRSSTLARREKAAALAVVLPALSRFAVKLTGHLLSRRGGSPRPRDKGEVDYDRAVGRSRQGRNRWHGGS